MSARTDTKDELMEVATELFAAHGFAGTSIRDIARAMNMSISNIYHYFGNKEGLWLKILEYSVQKLPETLREAVDQDAEPLEKLRVLIQTHLRSAEGHRREWRIFFVDEERLSAEGMERNRKLQREILDIYLDAIREVQNAGYARDCHPKVLAFNIIGMINWYLRWFRRGGELSEQEAYDEIIAFIMRGIGAGDAEIRSRET